MRISWMMDGNEENINEVVNALLFKDKELIEIATSS